MNSDPIVIVSAARTAMGAFQGELKGFAAPEPGAAVKHPKHSGGQHA